MHQQRCKPTMLRFNKTLLSVALAAPISFTAVSSVAAAEQFKTLEEVTVTARKREESLSDTPIAVSAFSANALAARQIDGLGSIDTAVPNLVFDDVEAIGGSNAAASIFIRGVGQTDFNQNTEPGVGLYIDGVYVARSVGAAMDLIDLEQVEVLRGPQGTLFGRNTIGGAISLTTKKPAEELSGYASLSLGTDNLTQFKGVINIPFSDKALSKFTIFSKQRDGYVERLADGIDLGNDDVLGLRADFRFLPSDSVTMDLALEKLKERENGAPTTALFIDETAPFASYHNFALNGAECGSVPSPASPNCYNSQFVTGNATSENGTGPVRSDLDITGASLSITWDTDNFTLKSITAYRDLESVFATDHDHSPLVIDHTANDYTHEQYSQEFQISGSLDNLTWIAGLYYFEEEGTDINDVDFSIGSLQSGGSVDNDATAIFGQLTYDFTDALSVTLGLRKTKEDKMFLPDQFYKTDFVTPDGVLAAGSPQVLPGAIGKLDVNETNYLLNISYRINEEIMVYASSSDGFKSGGFTQRLSGPPFIEPPAFQPEFVDVIEVGMKSELLDNRLRLNMAYFHTSYEDIQLNVLTPGLPNPFTLNAAEATIEGLEFELTAILGGLQINSALGYLDAGYDSASGGIVLNTVAGPIPVGTGLVNTNSKFVNAPEITFSFGLAHDFDIGPGVLTPRLDWFYRSEVYNDAINTPLLVQGSYDTLNLGLRYEDHSETWSVQAGFTNVTDEEYLITGYSDLGAVGVTEGVYARGREFQVEGQWRF